LPVPDSVCISPAIFRIISVKIKTLLIVSVLLLFSLSELNAQWVNNPAENTRVVYDLNNPININAVTDQNGGIFISWQDNITGLQDEVRFMHIDSNGDISFRADGKRISESTGNQENPVAVSTEKNNAVIAWKDFSKNKSGDLLLQKVQSGGSILWKLNGIKINRLKNEISDYSVCSNQQGEVFIGYIAKEPNRVFNTEIILQKISTTGRFLFDTSGVTVSASLNNKMNPVVLPDDSGGVYVLWTESFSSKGIINSRHLNKYGKPDWGSKPLNVTDNSLNVITYSACNSEDGIYLAYRVLKKEKVIFHQLISKKGKLLWGRNGKLCSDRKGNQSNPRVISEGNSLILSWTNETNNNKDIFIQRYDTNGKQLWKEGGVAVIKMNGDQFGEKIISDEHNGAIVVWLDRRTVSKLGNIYSQRISGDGNIKWDSSGIAIGSFFNTPKSYLNLLPDGRGSAIAVFKEKRKNENGIYVQKIFNTGTFVSQIIGFSTSITSDSVKISWYSANEISNSNYTVERSIQTDTGITEWLQLATLNSDSGKAANYYAYYDVPDTSGTLYYRIVLSDNLGNSQTSEASRVTFLESTSYIIVTQNNPNPFTDSTQIKFYLPEPSNVKIEYFDNHIEKIDETINDYHAGENSVTFYAGDHQPGIYFYKFESGDYVEVKKMVLTR
jgi:hypothetical protein